MGLLSGKRAVVTGVANKRSIAWGIAQALAREGAELALTYQTDRFHENLRELLPQLPNGAADIQLDVSDDASVERFRAEIGAKWDKVDIVVHSIAYAKAEDLGGEFHEVSRDGWALAQDVSAYSLVELTRALLPLLRAAGGGSVLTLTYLGGERVMPNYNIMGVAKAALESGVRYLAHDLGADNIRVNAISAGPLRTLASAGVKASSAAIKEMPERAPLRRNIALEDVGNAAVFLGSDWAQNITGQILYVDAGYHIMGY